MIQPGAAAALEGHEELAKFDLLTEDEYLEIVDKLPRENQFLEDSDPNKFICKMGAEAIFDLLKELDLDALSYELRDRAHKDSSQQRKTGVEASAGRGVVPGIEEPQSSGMDDFESHTGHPAGIAPVGAA